MNVRISSNAPTHTWDHSTNQTATICKPKQCESHYWVRSDCKMKQIVFKKSGHLFNGISKTRSDLRHCRNRFGLMLMWSGLVDSRNTSGSTDCTVAHGLHERVWKRKRLVPKRSHVTSPFVTIRRPPAPVHVPCGFGSV